MIIVSVYYKGYLSDMIGEGLGARLPAERLLTVSGPFLDISA